MVFLENNKKYNFKNNLPNLVQLHNHRVETLKNVTLS